MRDLNDRERRFITEALKASQADRERTERYWRAAEACYPHFPPTWWQRVRHKWFRPIGR